MMNDVQTRALFVVLLTGFLLAGGCLSEGPPAQDTENGKNNSVDSPASSETEDKKEALQFQKRDFTQDFPQTVQDDRGHFYIAVLARPIPNHEIRVYRLDGSNREPVATLAPEGLQRIGRPTLASAEKGCAVSFAVKFEDRWKIAFATVDEKGASNLRFVDPGGHANVQPDLARTKDGYAVVWESNASSPRGIYASRIGLEINPDPVRISKDKPGNNPSVVQVSDGTWFAAWDAVVDQRANLHGAWYRNGNWSKPDELTNDPRIERHPSLATKNGSVWMAWQTQRYQNHSINNFSEQRVAVARVDKNELSAPEGMVENVFRKRWMTRPYLRFDEAGRLWLTARKSVGSQGGWFPMIWSYSGGTWSGPKTLWKRYGRWRPVPLVFHGDRVHAAVQRDNLPTGWYQRGERPAWDCHIFLRRVSKSFAPPPGELSVNALGLPDTDFRLSDHIEYMGLTMPRQDTSHKGNDLALYWGDLHEHSSLSVCMRRKNPSTPDLFANQRAIQNLDFTAITDHGYNYDKPQWAYTRAQVSANYEPGRYVTLLGQEWTSTDIGLKRPGEDGKSKNYDRYGQRNIIFADPNHDRFYDAWDGDITPDEVWKNIDDTDFVFIPHQLAHWAGEGEGNPNTDWDYHHEHHQPLAEIFQGRGSFEALDAPRRSSSGAPFKGSYLQDAWAKGVIIGVIASPDHGGGLGMAGIWAKDLTRDALFEAFHKRHTFGTTGARISLMVKSGKHMMGDKVTGYQGEAIPLHIEAKTTKPIKRVVILRNNETVHTINPDSSTVDASWTDENPPDKDRLWYYVRIHRTDNELAWSSPIWFLR